MRAQVSAPLAHGQSKMRRSGAAPQQVFPLEVSFGCNVPASYIGCHAHELEVRIQSKMTVLAGITTPARVSD